LSRGLTPPPFGTLARWFGFGYPTPRFPVPGDVIEIRVAEIGTLRNTVVDET
jgi:2-keto-4-pentenoate hydratase/2-oxohepta-3-ene-1,7-dioic acid hydratase in catechol pathway